MKRLLILAVVTIGMTALVACAPAPVGDCGTDCAPDFDLAAFPEGTLSSADLRGKVVIVDFWATWCQPCIKELPDLNALYHEQDPEKFAMVGITIQSGSYDDVKPFIEELGIEYPVVMGDEAVETGFGGIIGFPTKFVIGPDWKIYKKYLGGDVKEDIEQDVEDLLNGAQTAQAF
jgi:thiol-disulfide isomerase/thioredoxin